MNEIRKDLPAMVEKMPAFSQSVHRVIQLASDINSDPKVLVDVIQHDPFLMMRILKLVNSPYFGLIP
jgi:HD-like signal output (HDOD) protein